MNWSLLRTILILPGTALIYVPAIILWWTHQGPLAAIRPDPASASFWFGIILLAAGLLLAAWTVRLFASFGDGTPAPWDPPRKLVLRGPYRHVRNPMISSVLMMLLAEALLFRSWPLLGWMALFFAINSVYFPLFEEKGLERRFGDTYRRYSRHVPRWIPRLYPWREAPNAGGNEQAADPSAEDSPPVL